MTAFNYTVTALSGVPAIHPGDDLAHVVLDAMRANGLEFVKGDVLVLAQKIVSNAEARQIALANVTPSATATELAAKTGKDARLVELILSESQEVIRTRAQLIVVRHRLGLVLANAGIDQSNVGTGDGAHALLLPLDPDASAAHLRYAIQSATGNEVAVLIIDSLGRAWRLGTTGAAIGVAGFPALLDLRGRHDLNARPLESSELGLADEIAAAASVAMGQANEGRPIVLVRGLPVMGESGTAADLIRPLHMDLFR